MPKQKTTEEKPASATATTPAEKPARQSKAPKPEAKEEPARNYIPMADEVEHDGIPSPSQRAAGRGRRAIMSDPLPEGDDEAPQEHVYVDDPSAEQEAPEAVDDETAEDEAQEQDSEAGEATEGDDLESRAAKYGLDPADFTSPKALKNLIDRMEHSESVFTRIGSNGRQEPAESDATPGEPPPLPKYPLQLDPEVYDKGLIAQLEGMNEHYARHAAETRRAVMAIAQHAQQRDAAAFEERFDGWINKLGDDWKDTFGQGLGRSMDRRTKHYENRVQVLRAMDAIARSYSDSREPLPGEDTIRDRALRMVFGDKVEQLSRKKLSNGVQKRSGQIIARPTARTSAPEAPLDPDAKAKKFVAGFMRRKGFA